MRYIRFFDELGMDDVPLVGGKNASLGEMYRNLTGKGIRVPGGYATTAEAYWRYLDHNRLRDEIQHSLEGLNTSDVQDLAHRGAHIRSLLAHASMPPDLEEEIIQAYRKLQSDSGGKVLDVAVRSSATAEDLPDASFAGQQETYLNVCGEQQVVACTKRVFASLFTNRAISYRVDKGFNHMDVALSVGIQTMVRSDLATAGVMFSIDTETGFQNVVLITAAYGLGENIVQGAVSPDEFHVFKPTLRGDLRPILSRNLGEKEIRMVYSDSLKHPTRNVSVPQEERRRFCLTDDEVLTLARYAIIIEEHYSQLSGCCRPMDIEWAKDGLSGELFIVQARPETVHAGRKKTTLEQHVLQQRGHVLVKGKSVGSKIAAGRARIIRDATHLERLQPGDVLVTEMTDPDWEPIMKIAAAIVTNRGGRTCHTAIIARELGIPAVVGTIDATAKIDDRQVVTVSCAEGETGLVYEDELPYSVNKVDLGKFPHPHTKVMMNVASPQRAFGFSLIPNDGVGLARVEFIISSTIGIHPNALLQFDKLQDEKLRGKISSRTAAYSDPVSFYVEKLAEGVGTIAAAFYPKKVIVRLSDFKSNEYANLLGGSLFEPEEENPMLGFRGASRYYSQDFREAFALECRAMRLVREQMGLTNVCLMAPFVRTPQEAKKVLQEMGKHGLKRGENGLEVYMMCEVPANILDADAFLDHFDGFSIGSNDLTQLVLGVDRDSALVAHIFDERQPAMLEMLRMAVSACRKRDKYVGICGQAPSDYPDVAEFLVRQGITSISLNPDSVLTATMHILEAEKGLGQAHDNT